MPFKRLLSTMRFAVSIALALLIVGVTVWGALAIHYSDIQNVAVRTVLSGGFGLAGLVTLGLVVLRRAGMQALLVFAMTFMVLLSWWNGIQPSNVRAWQTDVARLAYAEVDGNRVTVHNVRNFDYRSESDYTPAWYDKTYDLDKLQSVDLVAVYWMGPAIAHTFLSFGFEGGEQLAVSIETRKEENEEYSTIKGFFKQYELYYVVADERDVIRLRTNYRKNPPEDTYIYRVHGPVENARRIFMAYIDKINALQRQPEFYNTLVDNCTTGIWMNSRINPGHLPLSWKILASGYVPQYLYEHGRLENGLSFEALQQKVHVNARAQAADQSPDFSRLIRGELPAQAAGSPDHSVTVK